ncbi:MAG TPA: DUF1540 domain-containing protein [Sphingobacteriaceae bacterium]|nr:DUF1540 domain-containing protein [Sphingobacteriaceae bacterium]
MTVVVCAATNCTHNDGGICGKDEIKLAFVPGSHVDLHCADFHERTPGGAKEWRGNTHALEQDYSGEGSESVSPSSQK